MDNAALISVRRPNARSSAALACSMGSAGVVLVVSVALVPSGPSGCAELWAGAELLAVSAPVGAWAAPAASAEALGAPFESAAGRLWEGSGPCAPPALARRASGDSMGRAV